MRNRWRKENMGTIPQTSEEESEQNCLIIEKDEEETQDIAEAMDRCCNILSGDLMLEILSRLPVKSLKRFSCVSKTFCALSHSPTFIAMHLTRTTINKTNKNNYLSFSLFTSMRSISLFSTSSRSNDADPIENIPIPITRKNSWPPRIAGSSNGLVCMRHPNTSGSFLIIWNPATGQFRHLPNPKIDVLKDDIYFQNIYYGFTFDANIEDFKLVRILFSRNVPDRDPRGEVLTLSTNSWRYINNLTLPCDHILHSQPRVLANGSMHWIGLDRNLKSCVVVAFDMGIEKFRRIEMPKCCKISISTTLVGFRETIAIVDRIGEESEDTSLEVSFDIWVLNYYGGGAEDCWTKQFTIGPLAGHPIPLGFWFNGGIIMRVEKIRCPSSYDRHRNLIFYEGCDKEINKSFPGGNGYFEVYPYIESLVLVK